MYLHAVLKTYLSVLSYASERIQQKPAISTINNTACGLSWHELVALREGEQSATMPPLLQALLFFATHSLPISLYSIQRDTPRRHQCTHSKQKKKTRLSQDVTRRLRTLYIFDTYLTLPKTTVVYVGTGLTLALLGSHQIFLRILTFGAL